MSSKYPPENREKRVEIRVSQLVKKIGDDIIITREDIKVYKGDCLDILKNEHIEMSKDDIKDIIQLIKLYFPDIRKIINALQKLCVNGKFEYNQQLIYNFDFCKQIWIYLNTKEIIELRKFLIINEQSFNGDYNNLLYNFLNYIYTIDSLENEKKVDIILIITEFIYKSNFMMDLEINTISCFYTIYNKIIKK